MADVTQLGVHFSADVMQSSLGRPKWLPFQQRRSMREVKVRECGEQQIQGFLKFSFKIPEQMSLFAG